MEGKGFKEFFLFSFEAGNSLRMEGWMDRMEIRDTPLCF